MAMSKQISSKPGQFAKGGPTSVMAKQTKSPGKVAQAVVTKAKGPVGKQGKSMPAKAC